MPRSFCLSNDNLKRSITKHIRSLTITLIWSKVLSREGSWASCYPFYATSLLCQIMPVYEHTDRRKTQDINKPHLGACVIHILRMSSLLDKTQWRNRFCYKNFSLLKHLCSSAVCDLHNEVSGRPAVCVRSVFCGRVF